jgi:putative membrane protein
VEKIKEPPTNLMRHFLHGIGIGIAEAIPGVNGATVALLFGIYTRIMDALKNVTLLNLWGLLKPSQFYLCAEKMHLAFLTPLTLGSVIAIWALSGIIPIISKDYPGPFNAFIFGLVFASAYVPLSQINGIHFKQITIMAVSAAITFLLVDLPTSTGSHNWLFIYGVTGACALLLPGLSGSYLLKVFGQYEYLLSNLHKAFLFEIPSLIVVGVFTLGMVTGIMVFSKLLSYLLHHHQSTVMSILAGLMFGALRTLWPPQISNGMSEAMPLAGLMILGGLSMALLIKQERYIK